MTIARTTTAAFFALTCSMTLAQQEQPEPPQTNERQTEDAHVSEAPQFGLEATRFTFSIGAEASFNADYNKAPGSVSVFRQSAGVHAAVPIRPRFHIEASLDTEHAGYDFSDASGIVPGSSEPFDDLWRHRLGARAFYVHDATWSYVFGGSIISAGESGASFSDTITWRAFAGVTYRATPTLQIGAGAAIATRLVNDTVFLPLPLIDFTYAIDERTTLKISTLDDTSLTYQATEQLAVILSVGWRYDEYRLRDDGPVPDGVFSQWRVPVAATARWTPTHNLILNLTAGIDAYSRHKIEDSDGAQIMKSSLDPAPFIGATLRIRL